MKHLKPYKIFENKQPQHPGFLEDEYEIDDLFKDYNIRGYTINDDMSVDVEGNVDLGEKSLKYLPVKFNYISGDFYCYGNNLISLKGSPQTIRGSFDCSYNELTSLEGRPENVDGAFVCSNNDLTTLEGSPKNVNGAFDCSYNSLISLRGCPQTVSGSFNCDANDLTSLEGCPQTVSGSFNCDANDLTSLEGCPESVGGYFHCRHNKLKTLDGLPQTIRGDFRCKDNPIYLLVKTFMNKDNHQELLEEFNDYSIVRGDEVILLRLKAFIDDFDLEMPDLDGVKKHYKIV